MQLRTVGTLVLGLTCIEASWAGDIQGTVIITHRLTRRKVTVASSSYQRGSSVEVGSAPFDGDVLGYERSHVVLYVDGDLDSEPAAATMVQKNRRFEPDLLVISRGSTVSFPNLDPIFHNVFSLSKPKSFDLGNYANGQTRSVTFSQPGIVLVNCRLHTNMTAAIIVTPNQWSTRSDAEGRFEIRNVPNGVHTLIAWHKTAGLLRQTVTVSDTRKAIVQFPIPLDENGQPLAHR